MEYNEKHYYKIDVIDIKHGYSFVIATNEELNDEYDAIEIALENGLFQDNEDAEIAIVDDLISKNDIKHFIETKCVYNI